MMVIAVAMSAASIGASCFSILWCWRLRAQHRVMLHRYNSFVLHVDKSLRKMAKEIRSDRLKPKSMRNYAVGDLATEHELDAEDYGEGKIRFNGHRNKRVLRERDEDGRRHANSGDIMEGARGE